MRNNHDLTLLELQEVFCEAEYDYLLTGNDGAYVARLRALGIDTAEIKNQLRELQIKRSETFNHQLAAIQEKYRKD